MARSGRAALVVAAALAAAGCATPAPEGALIADPYEPLNRDFHEFNKGWDLVLLRPATYIYREATPTLAQFLVGNAVDHISLPVIFFNNVLQGDVTAALNTAGRFTVNTIVGAGGLLDPATEFGLPYEQTDGGLTLAEYGAEEGPYIVLPFLGPGTGRDVVGRALDFAIDPFNFVSIPGGTGTSVARITVPIVDARSENFELVDDALYNSDDSYVTVRTAYILSRRNAVAGGTEEEALPDIFGDETE